LRISAGDLPRRRLDHSAALVAGEVERFARVKAEPSLVLSIPAKPTEDDDGLLRASDVALLKMNSDFVVLSACNTAAGEKAGAEALSGLARAFFYAGDATLAPRGRVGPLLPVSYAVGHRCQAPATGI